ncbi:MAG: DUF4149 domain-containing protein [Formosimonas sp.]
MKTRLLSLAAIFALVLWAGATWAAGYVFAPTWFAAYGRVQAGEVAGHMFAVLNRLGLVCAMVLLLDYRVRAAGRLVHERGLWLVLGLVFALIVQEFGLTPLMQTAKLSGDAAQFGRLHGISQVLYLAQSLALAALVWLQFNSNSGADKPK